MEAWLLSSLITFLPFFVSVSFIFIAARMVRKHIEDTDLLKIFKKFSVINYVFVLLLLFIYSMFNSANAPKNDTNLDQSYQQRQYVQQMETKAAKPIKETLTIDEAFEERQKEIEEKYQDYEYDKD